MAPIGHSTLLKFFTNTSKMSEGKTDASIESKVPGEQTIRGDIDMHNEIAQAGLVELKDFTQTPVIKVTKEESSFTRGDLKLQKVLVTEDISNGFSTTRTLTTDTIDPNVVKTELTSDVSCTTVSTDDDNKINEGSQRVVNKLTRIPKLQFKHAVDKIKKQEEMIKGKDEAKLALQVTEIVHKFKYDKNSSLNSQQQEQKVLETNKQTLKQYSPKVEDEFDKIYDEICDSSPTSGNFPSPDKNEDPDKLEIKFDEIIHAYDEQKAQTTNTEKVKSKIPLLKRKSEQEIDVTKAAMRRDSLKKTYSVDDSKCKLPVPVMKEKNSFESDSSKTKAQASHNSIESKITTTNNVTVFETVNTTVSKTIIRRRNSETHTQDTESNSMSLKELSKSKIPTHLKKTSAKTASHERTEISSQLNADNSSDISSVKTHKPETVHTEDYTITLNVDDETSKVQTIPSVIAKSSETINTIETVQKEIPTNVTEKQTNNNNNKDVNNEETRTEPISQISKTEQTNSDELVNSSSKNEDIHSTLDTKQSQNENPPNVSRVDKKDISNRTTETVIISQTVTKTDDKYSNELITNSSQTYHINKTLKSTDGQNDLTESSLTDSVTEPMNVETERNKINQTNSTEKEDNEKVKVISSQYSTINTELKSLHHNNHNNISSNITTNASEDISQVTKENKSIDANKVFKCENDKEIKLCDKNITKGDVDIANTKCVTSDELKIQDDSKNYETKCNNEINNTSQEYNLNKLESESIQRMSDYYFKKTEHKTATETKTESVHLNQGDDRPKGDKEIVITTQQSKIQPEEATEVVITKNITHQDRSENISKKTNTEINDNEIKTREIKGRETYKDVSINGQSISSLNLDELEEEDIIILKGKVNRIISRLDSREFKISKPELEDVPRDVSVGSKIALFEQSKSNETKQNESANAKMKVENEMNANKPKIVEEILKTDITDTKGTDKTKENSKRKDESKFSYDVFLNYKNNIQRESRIQSKMAANFDEIYNADINLNNIDFNNRTVKEDHVFVNKDVINEYKMNKEIDLDMRRAKSLAELGHDGVRGRVRQMVVRMNSLDRIALERRQQTELRKASRQGSVIQRIALFEKKVTPTRLEPVSNTVAPQKQEEDKSQISEEELVQRIAELSQARVLYGSIDNMTYIELKDGSKMPTIALGTALLQVQLIKPIIRAAIDLGYRAIDTAFIYGNEQAVGEAVREKIQDGTVKREELFIISKLWSTSHRRELVSVACRQSLDAMGLEYFDLYLIHNPMSFKEGSNPLPKIANVLQYSEHDYLDAWFGIEDLIKQGLVRRGGVSNFNSVQVQRVLDKGKIKPVINQVECHPYLSQARLHDFLSPRGVALSCFGCLGSAGTPSCLRSAFQPVIQDPLVRTMAAGLGVSPAQLLISYQVQLGRGVVVKASSAAHLWDDLRALQLRLEPAHLAALAALHANRRTFAFQGMGDTHKNYPFKIPF